MFVHVIGGAVHCQVAFKINGCGNYNNAEYVFDGRVCMYSDKKCGLLIGLPYCHDFFTPLN